MKVIILSLLIVAISSYNRGAAVNYAVQHVHNINHRCGSPLRCTPWAYFGSEHCGYPGQGGDCANFVSQCVVAGGHPPMKRGGGHAGYCRGYPCGKEEPGAGKLGSCLQSYGWSKQCGRRMGPPGNIQVGDVLIYAPSCGLGSGAHAVLVTQRSGGGAKITCHSNEKLNVDYTYMRDGGHIMYGWYHFPG